MLSKLLLPAQLKVTQAFASGVAPKAGELLSVSSNDEIRTVIPVQHGQEQVMQVPDVEIVRDGDHPSDQGIDIFQDAPQHEPLDGRASYLHGCSQRTPYVSIPLPLGLHPPGF